MITLLSIALPLAARQQFQRLYHCATLIGAAVLLGAALQAQAQATEEFSSWGSATAPPHRVPGISSSAPAKADGNNFSSLPALIAEALKKNPEIQAALREREAASHRIAPAGALDDPVLEAGIINAPLASSPFNREDMTMKMIGLSQNLPFPGKRGLRRDVAAKDAEAVNFGYEETVNRVIRDVQIAYFNLGLTLAMTELVEKNKTILERFLRVAEGRYEVGQANQADVLKAQTQVSRMVDELLRLAREKPAMEAELARALGRNTSVTGPVPIPLQLTEKALDLESLRETALAQRPRLRALQSLVARNEKAFDLARKNYYPDLNARLSYGQRDSMLDGARRADMVSLTLAINLPIWRENKLEPRVMETLALRDQAQNLYEAQRNEIVANLRQQMATAEQSFKSAQLYQTTILPQARLTVESALAAYRVNRVDFLTLLDSQLTVFNYEISLITVMAGYQKALAEIDLLTGKSPINRIE